MSVDPPGASSADETLWERPGLHFGIAEQGKLYALEGKHDHALVYYREAIRLTVQAGEPEIVFRHYLECVLESLELAGAYPEVLDYCEKAIALLANQDLTGREAELAHVYQRQGAVRLKAGDREGAMQSLRKALESGAGHELSVALAKSLLSWLQRGLQVDARRVFAEQQRSRYFSVRQDTVDPGRAIRLPNEQFLLNIKPA